MPEQVRFRCNNCGHRFVKEVLTTEEKQRAREEYRSTSNVRCPECKRDDLRRGWE